LRQVRSEKPADPQALAAWRVRMAEALEALAPLLLFPEDRERAAAEARAARAGQVSSAVTAAWAFEASGASPVITSV
jgi:hypothetical protein